VVKFELSDIKGWKSATHLPPPWGYRPDGGENPALYEMPAAPEAWVGIWAYQYHNDLPLTIPSSILPDNAFGKYGRTITVNVSWKEFLCPYDFPSQ